MKFEEFELSPEILSGLTAMNFTEASPIQEQAIPVILSGKDLVGQAQTGTGKTAAFGIPVLEKMSTTNRFTETLVLCPTRELAVQITEELRKIARFKKLQIVALYGGQNIESQFRLLNRGANLIVATPGRLIDHLKRGSVRLNQIKTLVLDEVDEMLNIGFKKELDEIFDRLPQEHRQTIFFSATISERIMSMAMKYQDNPKLVKVESTQETSPNIEQFYLEVKERAKLDTLKSILEQHKINFSLIFCNTKVKVDELVEHLNFAGYYARGLHGDMRQSHRDRVMQSFRKGQVQILVATDIAARGIDVSLEAVINYDFPQAPEHYTHRIGRTGRAGRLGKAFTFVGASQIGKLNIIKRLTKATIKREQVSI
jgi:ATP-dependent RNA helicase DeaD